MKYLRKFQGFATACILALSLSPIGAQADFNDSYTADAAKLVVQVSTGDPKDWNLALNNIKNVKQELGAKNVDIEIVAYGPGIGMLKIDTPVANRIDDAILTGVKIVACENTMKALKLTKDDMLASITYVPAGVIELMKKQKAGYAYIRP
jgi:hypothetical protein